jgi:hypothetical protein
MAVTVASSATLALFADIVDQFELIKSMADGQREGVGFRESGEFAPAHAGVGGGDHQDLIAAAADAFGDAVDLLRGGGGSVRQG